MSTPPRSPTQQRSLGPQPPARVHELAGRRISRRLARDDPSLDRRRAHQLLQDTGRSAALLARPARLVHGFASPRRKRRKGAHAAHRRRPAGPRRRRLSLRARPGLSRPKVAHPLSSPGGRTSRAAGGRTRSPAAGRSCRRHPRSARRPCRPGRARPPGARRRRRRAARASGCGSSAGPRRDDQARAVSEWGAMKDTTQPSTPQAITGPPLARL